MFNPNPDQDCIFPFTIDGKKYTKCTDFENEYVGLKNICATETKGEDNEITQYGVCSKDCDKIGTGENNYTA